MHKRTEKIDSRGKTLIARTAALGLLALAAPLTGSFLESASAAAPGDVSCFGSFVSFGAQNPPFGAATLGEFVSGVASGPSTYGQDDVPFYKSLACG